MISLSGNEEGRMVYDIDQAKSLEFIHAANDYYFRANIYLDGTLEEDKSLMFVIDKSNIEFYNTFANFFNSIKAISLKLKTGESEINIPQYPFLGEMESRKPYDINELYDEEKNRIKWLSEAGNSEFNLNADTVMFIEGYDTEFRIIFINDELCKINERYPRNVCVCNSGSESKIFLALCWAFDQDLRRLPITISNGDAQKVLRKSQK